MTRNHQFEGRHALRNRAIWDLYRCGAASINDLAQSVRLTPSRVRQILSEAISASANRRYRLPQRINE